MANSMIKIIKIIHFFNRLFVIIGVIIIKIKYKC